MKKTTVRELRYHFREIEARLNRGGEIVVHKRQRVTARLLPVRPRAEASPDISTRCRRIFGRKKPRKTGTDLVSEEWD